MMFYYKDITQVCTAFLRMINAVSMCGMTAAVALRVYANFAGSDIRGFQF